MFRKFYNVLQPRVFSVQVFSVQEMRRTSGLNSEPLNSEHFQRSWLGFARASFEWLIIAVFCLQAAAVSAVAPHQVALLINEESTDSLRVAREYGDGRGIPGSNRIGLRVPERFLKPVAEISADEFTSLIWQPAQRLLAERGLESQILVWIYSVDFPLRVTGEPPLSLTGLTFLRNRWPDAGAARDGRYASLLYGGPDPGDGAFRAPAGLDFHRTATSGDKPFPLPAAMLGYTGPGGNSVAVVLRALREGTGVDGSRPRGAVYFVTSLGIRSQVRQWQFQTAAQELASLGVRAVVTEDFPADHADVLGLLAGTPDPRPDRIGRFMPGAFAEHLTSFSAVYEVREHTKMTDWMAAGASASAGMVTEPLAYWTKFPTARFFVYYAAGCTFVESFYQAVRSPLQIVPIGDPLMRPFGPTAEVVFDQLPENGRGMLRARVNAARADDYLNYTFWINDQVIRHGDDGRLGLDVSDIDLPPGDYWVRVAAQRTDRIRHSVWAETLIRIPE